MLIWQKITVNEIALVESGRNTPLGRHKPDIRCSERQKEASGSVREGETATAADQRPTEISRFSGPVCRRELEAGWSRRQ